MFTPNVTAIAGKVNGHSIRIEMMDNRYNYVLYIPFLMEKDKAFYKI